jgi:hypothetical protein
MTYQQSSSYIELNLSYRRYNKNLQLLKDAKADALRRLPLYSCRITGFKFVCSKCYDRVYMHAITKP